MEMFAPDEEVARLEACHGHYSEPGDKISLTELDGCLTLAWYLRQSDPARALQILDYIAAHPATGLPPRSARIRLIKAESYWLNCQFDLALSTCAQAQAEFAAKQDYCGLSDCHWLLGYLALEMGDSAKRSAERAQAAHYAHLAQDPTRELIANASLAIEALMRDLQAAKAEWLPRLPALDALADIPLAARAWIHDFHGIAASTVSDFAQAALKWITTFDMTLSSGQVKRAIVAATNIGDAFNCLNEHQAALEWMQRGLDLANQHGWPSSIALAQMQTAETMRRLGRLEAAEDLLQEALRNLRSFNSSRNYVTGLTCLADLRLNQQDWYGALACFQQLQVQADALAHFDFQIAARRGQAHALAQLGQIKEAWEFCLHALQLGQQVNDVYRQIDCLCVLADIYGLPEAKSLPQPSPMQGHNPRMHYLLQARQLAGTIEGFTVSASLLSDLAREYARHGEFEIAFQLAEDAALNREKTHNQETTQRAVVMQIQHQTIQARVESEKARAESVHHQQMAAEQEKRAQVLEKTSETLERLSQIGQEITSQLDISVVFEALNRHVHGLLDVACFIILMLSPDGQRLAHAYSRENGKSLDSPGVMTDHPTSDSARCYRGRCEILRDYGPDDETPNLIPGSLLTRTALFAPLAIGEKVLGVMSIQSLQRNAFGERERLIFRTLCAYGAIALDNAHAYRQLQEAQNHLVAQEKLAALGAMVAGVAHELNTPLGNCLMITSSLQEKTREMERLVHGPALQRQQLLNFIDDVYEAGSVLMRGLSSAADLVSSFKQVAVDRTTAQRRRFELQQTCHEIIATMMNQIKISGHQISLEVPPDIWLESYPGPFGQVITNLINNAMLHAFEGREQGQMKISAQQVVPERVEIRFSDDGVGITRHNLRHIFDPFFTTKMGQGGTGLGLSISFNIITSLLNGQIHVESELGQGSTFILDLPLHTPAPPPT